MEVESMEVEAMWGGCDGGGGNGEMEGETMDGVEGG